MDSENCPRPQTFVLISHDWTAGDAAVYVCRRSLKWGTLLYGAMASVNGFLFSAHFRRRMMLRHRVRWASYTPTMVIPLITTTLIQDYFAYQRLLDVQPPCVVCSQINAMTVQV